MTATACPRCGSLATAVVAAAGVLPSATPALALRCAQCGYEGADLQADPKPPEGIVRVEVDLAELAKLDLRAGEVLLLRVPDGHTAEEAWELRGHVLAFLADNGIPNDVLSIPKAVSLAVLTPPEDTAL